MRCQPLWRHDDTDNPEVDMLQDNLSALPLFQRNLYSNRHWGGKKEEKASSSHIRDLDTSKLAFTYKTMS